MPSMHTKAHPLVTMLILQGMRLVLLFCGWIFGYLAWRNLESNRNLSLIITLALLTIVAVGGIAASFCKGPAAMWLFLGAFLCGICAICLTMNVLILRGEWWEKLIALLVQMGFPALAVLVCVLDDSFRKRYARRRE